MKSMMMIPPRLRSLSCRAIYYTVRGECYFALKNYEASLVAFETTLERNPVAMRQRVLKAAALYRLGRVDDAEWEMEEVLPRLLILPAISTRDAA